MGVGRELIYDYTNPDYPEGSMRPETLIRFAEYFGEERYYFCNGYHKFLAVVDGGSFLSGIRKKRNMSQSQFARWLGIPLANYKKYENGKCRLPEKVFDRLKEEAAPLLP